MGLSSGCTAKTVLDAYECCNLAIGEVKWQSIESHVTEVKLREAAMVGSWLQERRISEQPRLYRIGTASGCIGTEDASNRAELCGLYYQKDDDFEGRHWYQKVEMK